MEEWIMIARIVFVVVVLYLMVGVWAGYDEDVVGWLIDKVKSFKNKWK